MEQDSTACDKSSKSAKPGEESVGYASVGALDLNDAGVECRKLLAVGFWRTLRF